jgi:excisionase family DNA binding protein
LTYGDVDGNIALSKVVLSDWKKANMNAAEWSDLPLVLTSDQAALVLQVTRRTLTNMLDRGVLRGVKIGKEWRVSRAEMMRFAEGNGAKTPAATASTGSTAPVLINKSGLLVVRAEPLTDLTDTVQREREQRVVELMRQAGL